MREMVAEAGIRPDYFLKVNEFGLLIGKDTKNLLEEVEVEFRLSAPKPYYSVRFGNPAKYLKSYDRVVETRSKKPWSQCIAEAMAADPRCTGDYASLDLLMTSTTAIKSRDEKVVLCEAGQTLGWACSITNWALWAAFIEPYYKLMDDGYISPDALVRGKLVHTPRSSNGNNWGLIDFKDFTIVEEGQAA